MYWLYIAAKPEYAAAKIAVWWDIKDCPIPEGYDARKVRPSIEGAFKHLGYCGPVSITAYGDQKQTPVHIQRALSSTGVVVAHTLSESTCALMFSDMLEWRARNPPPASMMLISNQVNEVFSWDLARLQQETKYNIFLVYSNSYMISEYLDSDGEWRWNELLGSADNEHEEIICRKTSAAMFYCKSCNLVGRSLVKFRKHLSSTKHDLKEIKNPTPEELYPVTRMWGRTYPAKPEYATAKIAVWWDMNDCQIPKNYDPRRVRPRMEAAFKDLGYSGPVTIIAFADHTQTDEDVLQGLFSTGVDVVHTNSNKTLRYMFSEILAWQSRNPPPATIMVISDDLEHGISYGLARQQQSKKYNLFLAYSYRPYNMLALVTSAEWLWENLLAVLQEGLGEAQSTTRRHVLQEALGEGQSSTTRHVLQEGLGEGQSSTTRHVLQEGLGEGQSSTTRHVLQEGLGEGQSSTTRHVLQEGLGEGQSTTTRHVLRKGLGEGQPTTTRHVLRKGLGEGQSTTTRHVLQKCSGEGQSTTRRHVLREGLGEGRQSTRLCYCTSCNFDCKSVDELKKHFSTEDHANGEADVYFSMRCGKDVRDRTKEKEYFQSAKFSRSKRLRKTFRTGFRHFHKHLHMAKRSRTI